MTAASSWPYRPIRKTAPLDADFYLINLEKEGITKNGTQAYYDNMPIKKHVELDFTTSEGINKAIDIIINVIKEYKEKYENIIDKAMM